MARHNRARATHQQFLCSRLCVFSPSAGPCQRPAVWRPPAPTGCAGAPCGTVTPDSQRPAVCRQTDTQDFSHLFFQVGKVIKCQKWRRRHRRDVRRRNSPLALQHVHQEPVDPASVDQVPSHPSKMPGGVQKLVLAVLLQVFIGDSVNLDEEKNWSDPSCTWCCGR